MAIETMAAWAWLSAIVGVAVCYLLWLARNSDYGPWESILYCPAYIVGRLLWRVHFLNEPPAEIKDGAILVANHRSSLDPFFVQLAAKRRVHWMVAKEYCDHFLFGPLLKVLQVIPTNRSGMDTRSTRVAMRLTKAGRLVGMFPEGRLNHTKDPLVSIRAGAATVAIKSTVPIIPLFINGSPYRRTVWSPVTMPAKVGITFGEAIYAEEFLDQTSNPEPSLTPLNDGQADIEANSLAKKNKQALRLAAENMMFTWGRQILSLSGHPDFPITLAGRRKREVGD